MSLIVNHESELNPYALPPELTGIMTMEQWNDICVSITSAGEEGTLYGCAFEVCCCLVCAFPCIFLCHPCIAEGISKHQLEKRHFHGQPIVAPSNKGIFISYARLQTLNNSYDHTAVVVPVVSPIAPKDVPIAVATVDERRLMHITIPEGVSPGEQITQEAPDGSMVSITVPYNVRPGFVVAVEY